MDTNTKVTGHPLAVVTGASSGIGYELARVFAQNGFDLYIVAEDANIFTAAEKFKSFGGRVEAAQIDLAKKEGVEDFYQKIRVYGKPVEAAALNAGVGVSGSFIENKIDEEENLINLNIMSTVRLAKHLLQDMVSNGRGRILFTSSIAAEMPGPYYACYAASKSFIQSFAEALREEVKDKGVVITALQPGATETKFFERAHMLDTPTGQAKKDSPAEVAEDGFKALMEGKDHVVAGSFKNKVQASIAKFMSESQQAKTHAKQTKPFSEHH